MYTPYSLKQILCDKKDKELIFIHTPKCAGSYVSEIMKHLKIKNKFHNQAILNEGINFTIIRNPIDRFESLLNYRLSEKLPRNDWPKRLEYVYNNQNIQLDNIVSEMTDEEILGFLPYKTLTYWTKNVDIIITLENLHRMLEYFGYKYDTEMFKPKNVSNKTRGNLNEENRNRIKNLFMDDMLLYDKVISVSF